MFFWVNLGVRPSLKRLTCLRLFAAYKAYTNGHGNIAAPDNEIRHVRFPLPIPPPRAGEGEYESRREFHVKILAISR